MRTSTDRFVTQMKLAELRRQREKLRADYQAIAESTSQAVSGGERLERLLTGLQEVRFAQTSLHEDVAHMHALLKTTQADGLGREAVDLWIARLEKALAAGRLRAEVVCAFGALLEEWARDGSAGAEAAEEECEQQRERLIEQLLAPTQPLAHHEVFAEVFRGIDADLDRAAPKLKEAFDTGWESAFVSSYTLQAIQQDIYQAPELRDEARRFSTGDAARDFADAVRLMFAQAQTWDWPAEGIECDAVWTRNKWRLYVRPDLPTACLLGEVAEHWSGAFERCFGEDVHVANRRIRLQKLRELNAPEVILQNEIRMLRRAEGRVSLQTLEITDPWQAYDPPGEKAEMESPSVASERFDRQLKARTFRQVGAYADGYGGVSWSVLLTHAEVQLARAAFPDLPVCVVKVDLKDCFNSVSHEVLLDLLERLRVPESERRLVARFLAFPLRTGGAERGRAARGVPLGFQLSGFLANLLLQFLERYICLQADVRIVREVDDITLLAPKPEAVLLAWRRLHDFCRACGLEINEGKCGAVCIGPGELSQELPRAHPSWGMLELDEQGNWGVQASVFAAHLEQTREQLDREQAILSKVQKYNANARFLWKALAGGVDLGSSHREAVLRALQRCHLHFFGEGRGIVATLADEIRRRFLASEDTPIPESWMHWPVTAGGVGLRNVILEYCHFDPRLTASGQPRERVPAPEEREPGWSLKNNDWGKFYLDCITEIEPAPPKDTPQTRGLAQDFIARGKAVSGGKQEDLTPYWRWLLAIYGPEILERLGTFRFLITDLVPLQLISRQLLRESSLGGARSGEDL